MRLVPVIAAVTAALFLSACDDKETCTKEVAEKKAAELQTKMTALATSNPEKLAALAPKMQEIAGKMTGNDVSETCKALDEIAAELDK